MPTTAENRVHLFLLEKDGPNQMIELQEFDQLMLIEWASIDIESLEIHDHREPRRIYPRIPRRHETSILVNKQTCPINQAINMAFDTLDSRPDIGRAAIVLPKKLCGRYDEFLDPVSSLFVNRIKESLSQPNKLESFCCIAWPTDQAFLEALVPKLHRQDP